MRRGEHAMSYWWHVAYSRPEFRPLRWFSRARSGCLNWLGQFPAPVQVDLISQVRTAFRFPLIHVGATAKRQSTACNVSNLSRPSGSPLPIAARCAVLAVLLMMAGARTQAQTPLPPAIKVTPVTIAISMPTFEFPERNHPAAITRIAVPLRTALLRRVCGFL